MEEARDGSGIGGRQDVVFFITRLLKQHCRSTLAESQARTSKPRAVASAIGFRGLAGCAGRTQLLFELGTKRIRAGHLASNVVTDMRYARRTLLHREQGVKARDSEGFRRWNREAFADVIERALADPAHPALHRVEGREE